MKPFQVSVHVKSGVKQFSRRKFWKDSTTWIYADWQYYWYE